MYCAGIVHGTYSMVQKLYLYGMYKAFIGKNTFAITGKENDIVDGEKLDLDILEFRDGKFHIIHENKSYLAEILSFDRETKSC
jgi:hypothetical protein